MAFKLTRRLMKALCLSGSIFFAIPSWAEENLAAQAQNPIANLISLPLQLNVNLKQGPNNNNTGATLNIQPVIPIELGPNVNLINRFVIPLVDNSNFLPGPRDYDLSGLGDILYQAILSPKESGIPGFTWGGGVVISAPTATDSGLGGDSWGLGPAGVAILTKGPWVVGGLAYNVWSTKGGDFGDEFNDFLAQPIINYNFPSGWYATSSPIITADWNAPSSDRWTVPIGLGFGKVVKFGKQPVNLSLQYYYNIERPTNAPEQQVRFQVQFLFPKSGG